VSESNPILQRYRWRIYYVGIWIVMALVQIGALYLSNPIPFLFAFADAALFTLFFASISLLLWYPVRFSSWIHSGSRFRFLPYTLLAVMVIPIWMVTCYELMQLLTSDSSYLSFLQTSTGWRVMQGALYYVVIVLFYTYHIKSAQLAEKMEEVKRNRSKQEGALTRIAVKDRQQIHVISIDEIDYIEAYGDYVQLHTAKGFFLKEQTMKFFEEHLPAQQFIRIHRSYFVNVEQVTKIELYEKETYRVWLMSGATLKASSSGYKRMKEAVRL
jgi:hypothetical protein